MLILLIATIFFVLLSALLKRNILEPNVLFNCVWAIVLFISLINPYQMYEIHSNVIFLIGIGILTFNFGSFASNLVYQTHGHVKKVSALNVERQNINIRYLKRINYVLLALLCVMLLRIIPYFFRYSGYQLRDAFTSGIMPDGSTFMTTAERLVYIHFGVIPACYAMFNVTAILWLAEKIRLSVLVVPIINFTIVGILTGGRFIFFYALVILIAGWKMRPRYLISAKAKKTIKKTIIWIIAFILGYVVFNTIRRATPGAVPGYYILKSIIVYFTGGIRYFDTALFEKAIYGLSDWTYGLSAFAGVFGFLYYATYFLSLGSFTFGVTSSFVQNNLNGSILIGPQIVFNAFPTMFYYPYRDFGIIGIIVLTFAFAVVGNKIYRKAKRSANEQIVSFYLEFVFVLLFSVCWWEPYRSEFWARLIWIIVAYRLISGRRMKGK